MQDCDKNIKRTIKKIFEFFFITFKTIDLFYEKEVLAFHLRLPLLLYLEQVCTIPLQLLERYHHTRFAMVFQNAALLDSFTVLQNVALPLYERGEKDAILIKERVSKCLQMVGLENTVNLYPAELSGGMRKRIGIARALVYEPDYIIFDEPVSGLDPITSKEIMFYITRIVETASATLITITHELKDIQTIGNQILFLDAGRVVFNGKTNDLSQSPDPLLQEYLQ